MRIKDGDEEQHQQDGIDDVGECVVETIVEQQDDGAEQDAGAYPDDLHARAGVEAEDVGLAIRVAGAADADPSETEQGDVDEYRPPVYVAQHAGLLVICWLCHKRCVGSGTRRPSSSRLLRVRL